MYIGKTPTVGNFQVCDAISVVNGQAAYTLQVGGTNVAPESANHMLVSLNGVLQKPGSSFTISGSTMTFASNLATGDVIDFVQILGNVLDIGQPSDDTVGAAQIKNDLISGTTALAAEPADTDEFLVSDAGVLKRIDYSLIKGGGKIGQVVQAVKTDTFTSTSGSLTDITGMSAAITPSATSSKVLVKVVMHVGMTAADRYSVFQLVRGSTAISLGAASSSRSNASFAHVRVDANGSANEVETKTITFLDSPSTTSETTYKMQGLTQTDSSPSFTVNRSGGDADAAHGFRVASSITLMEVLA
tara:strand:+ start:359 stop:1264 length:906 start_codon:yes stop_codon:yes gene_type:complete